MNTLKFETERHLEHMVSYQRMQSGFPVLLVGVTLVLLRISCSLAKPDISYFSKWNMKICSTLDRYDHILPLTNHKSTLDQLSFIYN